MDTALLRDVMIPLTAAYRTLGKDNSNTIPSLFAVLKYTGLFATFRFPCVTKTFKSYAASVALSVPVWKAR